jgi:hypothetical protein
MLTKITDDYKTSAATSATVTVIEQPRDNRRMDIDETGLQDTLLIEELKTNLATLNRLVAKVQFMNNELKGLIKRR